MTLARERAIDCAYLVSGDEDLREGVVAAQDMGVQVVLLGVPGSHSNQSAALIREADEHVVLPKEHWAEHFRPKAQESLATQAAPSPASAQTAGRAFALTWAKKASADDLDALLAEMPQIPRELDAELLVETEKEAGPLPDTEQELRKEMRAGFWGAIKEAKTARSKG
jgi:hypothetical protein